MFSIFRSRLLRQLRGYFQRVIGVAAVAAGVAGNQFQRIVVRSQTQRAQAAFLVFQSPAQQSRDLLLGERLQHIDAAAGEQRGDDFEGWILRGGTDQPDGSPLDVRQKGILLGLVEAVNLIDEKDGARVHLGGLRRRGHHLLDLLDAAHYGGELDKSRLGRFGDDLGQSGFAHSGRTPEDHGAGVRGARTGRVSRFALDLDA